MFAGEYWVGNLEELLPLAFGLAVRPAAGGEFLAIVGDWSGGAPNLPRTLLRFQPENIIVPTVIVGQIDMAVADIAFHPNGTLYGVIGEDGAIPGEIIVIDTDTGDISHPGIYGGGNGDFCSVDGHGIGFHPRTGLMYHVFCTDSGSGLETIEVESSVITAISGDLEWVYFALVYDENADLLLGPANHIVGNFTVIGSQWIDPVTGYELGSGPGGGGAGGVAFSVGAQDCNSNAVPDECDVVDGVASDFDADGLLDICDGDRDNDGLRNDGDVCDYTPPGETVTVLGGPPGAWTDDCLVNLEDYPFYAECLELGGPAIEPTPECLSVFDVSGDGDVDLVDFAALQAAFGA